MPVLPTIFTPQPNYQVLFKTEVTGAAVQSIASSSFDGDAYAYLEVLLRQKCGATAGGSHTFMHLNSLNGVSGIDNIYFENTGAALTPAAVIGGTAFRVGQVRYAGNFLFSRTIIHSRRNSANTAPRSWESYRFESGNGSGVSSWATGAIRDNTTKITSLIVINGNGADSFDIGSTFEVRGWV